MACGAAHVAEQAAERVRQVVGVDLTDALLDLGAQRLRAAGVTNVLLQHGTAEQLPFVDGSFDVVACRSALHHFATPPRAVAEMARVCRPGGHVVVVDLVPPDPAVREPFDTVHRLIDPSHVRALLGQELVELMATSVGPVGTVETSQPLLLPLDHVMTEVADRPAVIAALHAELEGGPPTGLGPVLESGQLLVSFTSTTVAAVKPPVPRRARTPSSTG